MSQTPNSAIAVIGIDIGKNSFHVVGHDTRGAIVLRQRWSRGQLEARLAYIPPCLIGMEACVGAHHLSRKLSGSPAGRPSVTFLPSLPVSVTLEKRGSTRSLNDNLSSDGACARTAFAGGLDPVNNEWANAKSTNATSATNTPTIGLLKIRCMQLSCPYGLKTIDTPPSTRHDGVAWMPL
jgi:hypothetical protein